MEQLHTEGTSRQTSFALFFSLKMKKINKTYSHVRQFLLLPLCPAHVIRPSFFFSPGPPGRSAPRPFFPLAPALSPHAPSPFLRPRAPPLHPLSMVSATPHWRGPADRRGFGDPASPAAAAALWRCSRQPAAWTWACACPQARGGGRTPLTPAGRSPAAPCRGAAPAGLPQRAEGDDSHCRHGSDGAAGACVAGVWGNSKVCGDGGGEGGRERAGAERPLRLRAPGQEWYK